MHKLVLTLFVALLVSCGGAPPPVPPAPVKFKLQEARISDIQIAITAKQLTTVGLVELYLARIKAYNGTCVAEPQGILGPIGTLKNAGQINALATLNLRPAALKARGFDERKARSMTDKVDADPGMPDALEIAALQDAEFAKTGKLVGPLHGVVMSIKDQYDTFDMRTTSGADAFYANDRPPDDATFIKRLRAAGAIILAKSNLGEYASGIPRSSFGGTFCNPYDTERSPSGSSSGSGSSVAANLVTCAIAEETGSSIRGPARANNAVGLAPTQELVSRDGMIGAGLHTRVGPICRTVEDVARIMDVIAGYDPKDELTVFSVGRTPAQPYASFAKPGRLDGLKIGVMREYMDKALFTDMDAQTIDIVDRAVGDMRKLGAAIVDPGAGGGLFTACIRKYNPQAHNKLFTRQYPKLFPVGARGEAQGDHLAKLLDMSFDPAQVPAELTFRDFGAAQAVGEGRFMMNKYLRERGDAAIRTNADLVQKARFHDDPQFPDRKASRANAEKAVELDMADRMLRRFAIQQMVLQCMQEQGLDAIVYPSSNLPPAKLGAPPEPSVNGRGGSWSFLGQQGFPAISVPAGFTSMVYDRVRDPGAPIVQPSGGGGGDANVSTEGTHVEGPIPAKLPVGVDIVGRPFSEPLLLQIAAAYEAATRHRTPPPGFGPLPQEL
jgi:Asp-tRNA(Asn)/Glu-tRNA(Gln) amidotransferase A subunit family amidase